MAALCKFSPLWASWHKTNYFKLQIDQHGDVLTLSPQQLAIWKKSWTTGKPDHRLNIDEAIEFVNGDLDRVHHTNILTHAHMPTNTYITDVWS